DLAAPERGGDGLDAPLFHLRADLVARIRREIGDRDPLGQLALLQATKLRRREHVAIAYADARGRLVARQEAEHIAALHRIEKGIVAERRQRLGDGHRPADEIARHASAELRDIDIPRLQPAELRKVADDIGNQRALARAAAEVKPFQPELPAEGEHAVAARIIEAADRGRNAVEFIK